MRKLKPGIQVINRKGIYYILDGKNRLVRFKPWLGDSVSFVYDAIMQKSIFPKKFGSDLQKHYEILTGALDGIHGKRVLELATGSGSAVHFLNNDNTYTGTDISPGLLKRAIKQFKKSGFSEAEFYVVNAGDLPFEQDTFDLCLCILALNFFDNAEYVFREVSRVLSPGGLFVCSVPIPERNKLNSTIRGTLYSEEELGQICQVHNLDFQPIPGENGVLLYFKAIKQG